MIAIYARQSIFKQDSISIPAQIEICKKEVQDDTVTVFSDKGYTGKNTDRPDFQKMLTEIKKGNIDKLIVYRMDRVSRNLTDFTIFYEILEKHNVKFISCTERFDTSTPIGKAMLSIIMVFAQMERETIAERVKDNYYKRGEKGLYLGGYAPFGYSKTPTTKDGIKTYTFVEKTGEAEIVTEIYFLYTNNNKTLGEIAGIFNNKYSDLKFSGQKISYMLHNPVYVQADINVYNYLLQKGVEIHANINDFTGEKGVIIYGERKNKKKRKFSTLEGEHAQLGMHKGLINADIWLLAQKKLEQNKQLPKSGSGKHTWLSGIIKCGYCGLSISAVTQPNTEKIYINCTGRRNKFCYERKKSITIQEIEAEVSKELLCFLQELPATRAENDRQFDHRLKELQNKLLLLNLQKKEINELAKVYTQEKTYNLLKELDEKITQIKQQEEEINDKILEIELKIKNSAAVSSTEITDFKQCFLYANLEDKKRIAREFIEKILVTDDLIEVFFKL